MLKSKAKSLTSMISEVIDSNGNENKRTKQVFQKKSAKIEAAVDLIDRISEAEEFYFQSIRDEFSSKVLNVVKNFGFDVCRACLSPELRLIKLDNENLTFFQTIIKLTVCSDDKHVANLLNSEPALMCEACLKDFTDVRGLVKDVNISENNYYESRNDEDQIEVLVHDDGSSDIDEKVQSEKESDATREVNTRDKTNRSNIMKGKGFKCKVYDKILVARQKLKKHLDNIYTNLKKFDGGSCLNTFFHKQHQHFENNQNQKKSIFRSSNLLKCTEINCDKSFKTSKGLHQHRATHSDERPFVCWCSKAFKRKNHLKEHQRTHKNEREGERNKEHVDVLIPI